MIYVFGMLELVLWSEILGTEPWKMQGSQGMKKMVMVVMMVMCLVISGFPSLIEYSKLDAYLDVSEQEVEHLRKEFADAKRLREGLEKGLLGIREADPEKMRKFKQRFDVSDKDMQAVLMDIIRELSVKTKWESHHDRGGSHDSYVENWLLRGAIIWMGTCADAEGKKLLLGIASDNAKDIDWFRRPAIESYLYQADVQETRDVLNRFLIGDLKVDPFSTYLFAVQQLYDAMENDTEKREAIVATVSAALTRENKDRFGMIDKLLAERSKDYAESPQRKAALQRINKPPEPEMPDTVAPNDAPAPPDPAPKAKPPNGEKSPAQPDKSPTGKTFLWLAIFAFAVFGGIVAWRYFRKRNETHFIKGERL